MVPSAPAGSRSSWLDEQVARGLGSPPRWVTVPMASLFHACVAWTLLCGLLLLELELLVLLLATLSGWLTVVTTTTPSMSPKLLSAAQLKVVKALTASTLVLFPRVLSWARQETTPSRSLLVVLSVLP